MAVGPANLLITDMLVSNWNQHECYTRRKRMSVVAIFL